MMTSRAHRTDLGPSASGREAYGLAGRCLLLAALMMIAAGCRDQSAKEIERASDLAFEGRYEEAVYVLDDLIASVEGSSEPEAVEMELAALFKAGRLSRLFLRRPKLALSYYQRIVKLSPGSDQAFGAREWMARIHLDEGDVNAAISDFQALVAGFPEREGVDRFQYELAQAYFTAGDHEQARVEAGELLERWPESGHKDRAMMLVATTYQVQGRLEQAAEAYEALEQSTEDSDMAARALFERAGCLAALERHEEAEEAYEEALEAHPQPRLVRMRLDMLRERMARRELENLGPAW